MQLTVLSLFFLTHLSITFQKKESFSKPRVRTPLQNRAFRMLETPCLRNLQVALEKATSRPLSVFEKRRYLVRSHHYQYLHGKFINKPQTTLLI